MSVYKKHKKLVLNILYMTKFYDLNFCAGSCDMGKINVYYKMVVENLKTRKIKLLLHEFPSEIWF